MSSSFTHIINDNVSFILSAVVIFHYTYTDSTVFYDGCSNLHSHQRCARVPFYQHPQQWSSFISDNSRSLRCEVSQCGYDLHFADEWCWASFHMPMTICASSEKCLFRSFVKFQTRFLSIKLSSLWMYILDINSLSGVLFGNIFSHSVGCLFSLLFALLHRKLFIWCSPLSASKDWSCLFYFGRWVLYPWATRELANLFKSRMHPTLCDPMHCSLPGSSVHRLFRQEYWSGLPFPTLEDLRHPGIEPRSSLGTNIFLLSYTWLLLFLNNFIHGYRLAS